MIPNNLAGGKKKNEWKKKESGETSIENEREGGKKGKLKIENENENENENRSDEEIKSFFFWNGKEDIDCSFLFHFISFRVASCRFVGNFICLDSRIACMYWKILSISLHIPPRSLSLPLPLPLPPSPSPSLPLPHPLSASYLPPPSLIPPSLSQTLESEKMIQYTYKKKHNPFFNTHSSAISYR